jgi:hypothetical protein
MKCLAFLAPHMNVECVTERKVGDSASSTTINERHTTMAARYATPAIERGAHGVWS